MTPAERRFITALAILVPMVLLFALARWMGWVE